MMGRRALDRDDLALPRQRAMHHLRALAPLWGVGASQVGALVTHASTHATPTGGSLVVFRQRVDGVPVYETRVSLLLDPRGALIAAGGQLRPRGHDAPHFARTHESSVRVALADTFGATRRASAAPWRSRGPATTDTSAGPSTADGLARGWSLDRPVRIRRVLYPLPDRLVPAHYAEVWANDELVAYVVSAEDGSLLMRRPLTVSERFDYTIYADPEHPLSQAHDSPFGDTSPDPFGMPVEMLPPYVDPSVVSMEGFNLNPAGGSDPWLADDAVETRGNNVDAYADLRAPDGFQEGDRRADVTSARAFDHRFDPTTDPNGDENVQAAVTHLFYVNNWMHDWFYELGFDEEAGNAQAENFGRGGEEEDVLVVQANDYSRRNNANMSTPEDGSSPRNADVPLERARDSLADRLRHDVRHRGGELRAARVRPDRADDARRRRHRHRHRRVRGHLAGSLRSDRADRPRRLQLHLEDLPRRGRGCDRRDHPGQPRGRADQHGRRRRPLPGSARSW